MVRFCQDGGISQQCLTVRKPLRTFISWSLLIPHKITVATKIETSCNGKDIVCVCVCVWPLPVALSQYFRGSRTPGDILTPSYWRVTWASIDSFRARTQTHTVRGSSAKHRLLHAFSVWPPSAESTTKNPTKSPRSCVCVSAQRAHLSLAQKHNQLSLI